MDIPSIGAHRVRAFRYIASAVVLLMLGEVSASAQSAGRVVRSPQCPYLDDVVVLEMSGLRVGDKEVAFDVPFDGNDDWLTRLVFRITNRGRKAIVAIVLTFGLLEGVDEELPAYASYEYGLQFVRHDAIAKKQGRSKPAILVRPGQEIELTSQGCLPYGLRHLDDRLSGTPQRRNSVELASISGARFHRANVMGADVWFADGSKGEAQLLVREKCAGKK